MPVQNRRNAASASPSSNSGAVASDVDDRALSAEAQKRVAAKAARPVGATPAAAPFPWPLFAGALVLLAGAAWATINFS